MNHDQKLNRRDRGLAYGDGLFETLRVRADGGIPLWPYHRRRLLAGCDKLGLVLCEQRLGDTLKEGVAELAGQSGVVKITVTRGVGGRGYLPPARPSPSIFSQTAPLPQWPLSLRENGLTLGLCQQPLYPDGLSGIKHLNRLAQVQARQEVARQGWHEGLLLSPRRQPLEATSMNLFAHFDQGWWTPDLAAADAGVKGVMRAWLLARLEGNVHCDLRPLSTLRRANAVFLCNSIVGVLPVSKLAQWHWPVPASVLELQHSIEALF